MSALMWTLGVLGYLAIGVGVARLRARQVMRRGNWHRDDLQVDMLALMFLWPVVFPVYLVVRAIRWVLFPRNLR